MNPTSVFRRPSFSTLLLVLALSSACGEEAPADETSSALNSNSPFYLPFTWSDSRASMDEMTGTVFIRVQNQDGSSFNEGPPGTEPDRENANPRVYLDRAGGYWAALPAADDVSVEDSFRYWLVQWSREYSFSYSSPPLDAYSAFMTRDNCNVEECLLQLWYTPQTISDTRQTELLWEQSPQEWKYTEFRYREEERRALSSVVEYDELTGNAIVEIAMLALIVEGDQFRVEYRPHRYEAVDYDHASRRSPTSDAGM